MRITHSMADNLQRTPHTVRHRTSTPKNLRHKALFKAYEKRQVLLRRIAKRGRLGFRKAIDSIPFKFRRP